MAENRNAHELFRDSTKINHFSTSGNANTYPYIDFSFEEGDPSTEAVLTVNVEDGSWYGTIHLDVTKEGLSGEGVEATLEQISALKASLPDDTPNLIQRHKERRWKRPLTLDQKQVSDQPEFPDPGLYGPVPK